MYSDVLRFARNCPECAIVSGGEKLGATSVAPNPSPTALPDTWSGYNGPPKDE